MNVLLMIICVFQFGLIVWILHNAEKERDKLTKMIASKSYAEYQGFETPVKNSTHSNLFSKRNDT